MSRAGIFGSAHVPSTPSGSGATFVTVTGSTSNISSFSFPGVPIGSPSATRRVVLALAYRGGDPVASVTIGGVSASADVAQTSTGNQAEIWSAEVPTGTTATISIAFTSAGSGVGVGVWTVEGDPVASAVMSPTNQATVNLALTTMPGDACIAVVSTQTATGTPGMVWAAATGRYDDDWDGLHRTHAGADLTAAGSSTDMGGVIGNHAGDTSAVAVAYR